MKITSQQLSSAGHLVGLMRKLRGNADLRRELVLLLSVAGNFRSAWDAAHSVGNPARQEILGHLSSLFFEIPRRTRIRWIRGIDWAESTQDAWPNTLIISGSAKMLRFIVGCVLALPAKQRATVIARSFSRASCWDQLIGEAVQQLPKHFEDIQRREYAVDVKRCETDDPSALETVIALAGQAFMMGYFPVAQIGPLAPDALSVGSFEVVMEDGAVVIMDPARPNLRSRFKYLPWIMRTPGGIKRSGELLEVLFEAWSIGEELPDLVTLVQSNPQAIKDEISRLWHELAVGLQRWVPPDGQVKLKVGDPLTRPGFNLIELHPGDVPSMRLRIHLLTYGFVDERWATLDGDGVMDLVHQCENAEDRQALFLILNFHIVSWLHYFATHAPSESSPGDGSDKKGSSGTRLSKGSSGLPPGWHYPQYMRTRGQMTYYAETRCKRRGMSPPAKGSGLTYREYPAGKRGQPLEEIERVKIDVTYELDL